MKHGLLRIALMLSIWITGACHAAGAPPRPLTSEETSALLLADDFPRLNSAFTTLQDAYRDGSISDESLRDAFRVFYDTSPARLVHINAWARNYPKVYVAQLARGIYFKHLGQQRRGSELIGKTSDQQLRGMSTQFAEARTSLYASFDLDKKPILSYLHAIDLAINAGDRDECERLLDLSLRVDPRNFIVRLKYMGTLQSRWGGSLQHMIAFADESKRAGISAEHQRVFDGLIAEERMWTALFDEHDYEKAARARVEAIKLGQPSCLDCFVGIAIDHGELDDAIAALTAALKEDPRDTGLLRLRIGTYRKIGEMKAAIALGDEWSKLILAVTYANGFPGQAPDLKAAKALFLDVAKNSTNPQDVNDAKRSLALIEELDAERTRGVAKH